MFFCCSPDPNTEREALSFQPTDDKAEHTPAVADPPKAAPAVVQYDLYEPPVEQNDLSDHLPGQLEGAKSFEVLVDIAGGQKLGIEVDNVTDDDQLVIKEIGAGVLQNWNSRAPDNQVVKVRDRIVAVNGQSGSSQELSKSLGNGASQLKLTFQRPAELTVSIKRPGEFGVKLVYKKASLGLLIKEIYDGGLFHKWNKENPSKMLHDSDRIVSINGKTLGPIELVQMMKDEKSLEIVILLYR
eukprot:TRINITY_DN8806_c2_g1_i1.p1 TRINITY_DN8806_c2_g1~~TRINITY_DN8806_c2_g1_i1.p1  ORF type:complete len:242 (-),score=55.75 TRINITY_DN8806_c2_g1_i1:349-1074(-)